MPATSRMLTSTALMLGLVVSPLAAGTASADTADQPSKKDRQQRAETLHQINARKIDKAVEVATDQIGDPYASGGDGPGSFDCSGLVDFGFDKAGFDGMPRTSSDQSGHVRAISKDDMKRGDLMFFSDGGDVYHVGIFLYRKDGSAVMVHSPSSGESVKKEAAWTTSWSAGTMRRPPGDTSTS